MYMIFTNDYFIEDLSKVASENIPFDRLNANTFFQSRKL